MAPAAEHTREAETARPSSAAVSVFFDRRPGQERDAMRKRRYTETFGCLLTVEERGGHAGVSAGAAPDPTQYLREHAIKPIIDAARQASALEV